MKDDLEKLLAQWRRYSEHWKAMAQTSPPTHRQNGLQVGSARAFDKAIGELEAVLARHQ